MLLSEEKDSGTLAVDEMLNNLTEINPEQRVCGGLRVEKTVEALGLSPRGANRQRELSRTRLHHWLSRQTGAQT